MHHIEPKRLKHFSKHWCLLFILCISTLTEAQENIYENFGVDDGLPSSEVYDTYQDKEGYIWFATDKGLSRYNGHEFENFNTTDGLTGNVILRFYPQKNGQVWCYSFHNKSLFYFDEVFNGFKQYEYNKTLGENLHNHSIIKSVYLDVENSLHIGGLSINGEIIINKDGKISFQHTSAKYFTDTINPKRIALKPLLDYQASIFYFTELATKQNDTVFTYDSLIASRILVKWLVDNEVAIFMANNCVELAFSDQENVVIKNKYSPIGVEVIDQDHFFIGYEFGGGKIVDRYGIVQKEFLRDQSVTSFLVDHEEGYWLTTLGSGVFYIKNSSTLVYNSDKTKTHHVNSLMKTNDNDLFIGYKDGAISKVTDNKMTPIYEQPMRSTHAIVEYDAISDIIYTYSNDELKENQGINSRLNDYVIKFSEPKDKTLFAASDTRFYEINADHDVVAHRSPYRVHDVCIWNNDTIIATPLGLIKILNNEYIPLSDTSSLFDFRSDDIDVNSNNDIIYVATQGAGVVIHNGKRFFNITENDGLHSNIVNEIYIENDSTVWACTNRGINRIIWGGEDLNISGISKKNGLLSNEVEDIEIINDVVWVGTKQGLCSFPKSQMNTQKFEAPYLKLKDVIVNNLSRQNSLNPSLTHRENEIDFILEGISYSNKDFAYYQFRLNKNAIWSTTTNRVIHFTSLAPGNYVFEAKMCADDQNCSTKILTYNFTIQAPFWKMWWFRLLCLSVLGILIYTFFKIKVLTYNKDIIRELIRLIIRKLKGSEMYFSFREDGKDTRIKTDEIIYMKSAGNYLDVFTKDKTHTIRMSIGKFLDNVPDKLEYVRAHRSYIVRIDKITAKSRSEVQLSNGIMIPVSLNHHKNLNEILF